MNKYFSFRSPNAFWRNWHGLLGVLVAVPLLFVTVTGLLLNHSEDIGLAKPHVRSEWVMRQYGFELDGDISAFSIVGGGFVSQVDDALIYKAAVKTLSDEVLMGGVRVQNGLCLGTSAEIHYFDGRGELVETLAGASLPSGKIVALGRGDEGRLVLRLKNDGGKESIVRFDSDLIEAKEETVAGAQWSEPKTLSDVERNQVNSALIGEGMPLDRVVLDLHSGRLFGSFGKWFMSLFSVLLIGVSISGLVIFFRNRTKRRRDCMKTCSAPCGDL